MGSRGHQLCPSPCIHTYAHMYTQRHTFTHMHIIHLHTNTHIYTHTHKHTHTIYSHIYILTYTHIHIYTCIHIHTIYSHTYTLIHIHRYTHTHIALICTRINITLWQHPLGRSLFYSFFLLFFNILPISQTACLGLYRYMCIYIYEFFSNLTSVPIPHGLRKQPEPELLESGAEQRVGLSCAEHEDPPRTGGVKGKSGLLTWTVSLLKEMAIPLTCKSSEPNSVTSKQIQ